MTAAEKRVERAIAGALARVDALWNLRELDGLIERNGGHSLEILRERIIDELAKESALAIYPERFASLLDAVRMAG